MKMEDFTHVLPEDKPLKQKFRPNGSQVYDLDEANKLAEYYTRFREQLMQVEANAKKAMRQKLSNE